jgi:trans-2,3-dihydro-3-hydroxyanthranilate isomerase
VLRSGGRIGDDPRPMRTFRYHRVDVFTGRAFGGNPLAVFPEADGLGDREMQQIAREMNLSETVFVFPPRDPDAAVRLRIFTVDRELPLAGHPVVGTHFVLAKTGRYELRDGLNEVFGELAAGVLPVEIEVREGVVRSVLMTQRQPSFAPAFTHVELLARALGVEADRIGPGDLPARVVDTGVPWLVVPLHDLRTIRSLAPDPGYCAKVAELCGTDMLYAFTQETEDPDCAVHARHVWFGTVTPGEDPVTGSAAGCLASYLVFENVLLAAPTAEAGIEQGLEIGRPGRVRALVDVEGGTIARVRVGGEAVHLGDGELWLG